MASDGPLHRNQTAPGPPSRTPGPFFHVVLHEPEIPNNTGNIGRTCVAVGAALHLIHPLGFDLSEKARRRAGLDYWPRLLVTEHASWEAYLSAGPAPRWLLTTKAPRTVRDAPLAPGDHLIFGRETAGLPPALLAAHPDRLLSLPMLPGERSLNLATAVCAVLYEGIHQALARGQARLDAGGRLIPGFFPGGSVPTPPGRTT
jgi:tRNA (cytidine/uridine-2'-O-)-methyltransferase